MRPRPDMSVQEVADALKRDRHHVYDLITTGRLAAYRPNPRAHWRITQAALDRYSRSIGRK